MRILIFSFTLLCASLTAQPQPIIRPSTVPTLALSALDNTLLLKEELALRKPGRAPYFAQTRKVNARLRVTGRIIPMAPAPGASVSPASTPFPATSVLPNTGCPSEENFTCTRVKKTTGRCSALSLPLTMKPQRALDARLPGR